VAHHAIYIGIVDIVKRPSRRFPAECVGFGVMDKTREVARTWLPGLNFVVIITFMSSIKDRRDFPKQG
jgi:hypothetical protein